MNVDMGLDGNQCKTYFDHSFNTNGSYQLWSTKYRNFTNDTYLQTVSPTYFYVSAGIWALPPFIFAILLVSGVVCDDDNAATKLQTSVASVLNFCFRIHLNPPYGYCIRALTWFLFLPFGWLISAIGIYICVPLMAMVAGIRKLRHGESLDESKDIIFIPYRELPLVKSFECFGEAIPQLILVIVYSVNNYPYLKEHDDYLVIGVPVSIISCVFSLGSIIIGVVNSFQSCKYCDD